VSVFTTFWNGGGKLDEFEGSKIHRAYDLSCAIGRYAAVFDLHYFSWGRGVLRYKKQLLECDVIHSLAPLSSASTLVSWDLPLLTHFHHFEAVNNFRELLFKPFHHLLERKAYRISTLVLTGSKASASSLERNFGVPGSKVRVIHLGVDVSVFHATPSVRSPNSVQILFVGGHEARKGVDTLIHAVAHLLKEGLSIHLVTVGDGPEMRALRGLSEKLGVSKDIEFLGYLPDPGDAVLPRIYAESDLFVLPSRQEGFGFVLLEAMASGTPIIATNTSAIPEVVDGAGILCPPDDVEALMAAIRDLTKNPVKRAELARQGRSRVESLFTWDLVLNQTIEAYEEAIRLAHESR
jgi:glycosyltransferase involved in cell wall biosynthesis